MSNIISSSQVYKCKCKDKMVTQTDYRKECGGVVSDIYRSECSGRDVTCIDEKCKFVGGQKDCLIFTQE